MIWGDIVIEHAKEGRERSDVVATMDEVIEVAEREEYDCKGEARIQIKSRFSFGTGTTVIKVNRVSTWLYFALCKVLS